MLGLPYVVISVVAGLQSFDATQEMVARSLGMNRLRSFFAVTLPQIKASVIAGGIFAFISAMDETIVALFISGGQYQPLTKRMFTALRDEIDPTIAAISTLMTAVSFMLVLIATSRSKEGRVSGGRASQAATWLLASAERGSRGSVMRTTVPVPSFERSRIVPPCRLVSERAMARPSPEPW